MIYFFPCMDNDLKIPRFPSNCPGGWEISSFKSSFAKFHTINIY